jgi:hypothetical protein
MFFFYFDKIFLPSVVALHNKHWNRRPPSINCMFGLMYALQRTQRIGPTSPKSTIGGCNSSPIVLAIGEMISENGTAACFIISVVAGTLYIVDLKGKDNTFGIAGSFLNGRVLTS